MLFPLHDDNPTSRPAVVTYTLVAVNVLAFLGTLGMTAAARQDFVFRHGFVPARMEQLRSGKPLAVEVSERLPGRRRGEVVAVRQVLPANPAEIVASLATCMFLHGGWLHLLGNMWFLWIFGNNVEDRLGHVVYLVFYLGAGLIASACHWLSVAGDPLQSQLPVIGASGAVAGVLGAYALAFPHARVHTLVFLLFFVTTMELPALLVLGMWFLGQILEATASVGLGVNGGVALWAHIGGFLFGLGAMALFDRRPRDDGAPWIEETQ